jgi:hypothetical protein
MPACFILTALLIVLGSEPVSKAQAPFKSVPGFPSVQEMVIATDVKKLKPVGIAESFPATVGKLFCFTRITGMGAREETKIYHLWFYGDHVVQEVLLPVKGLNWRTYSLSPIPPEWTGSWRVDITAEDGTLLKSVSFTIQ